MDFALLFDGQRCFCGWGRVRSSAQQTEASFWINTFFLDDAQPWKTFENFESSAEIPSRFLKELPQARSWKLLEKEKFRQLWDFSAPAKNPITQKIVLALSDVSENFEKKFEEADLPAKLSKRKGYFYAFSLGGNTIWGFTPELLFKVTGETSIESMALGGTFAASVEAKDRAKSLRPEHSLVVNYLREFAAAKNFEVETFNEETLAQGNLCHLLTRFRMKKVPLQDLNALIADLHPTPALGVYPKNVATLRQLRSARESLPLHYGAPFGVFSKEASFFVVLIRGLFCDTKTLQRPIGVGVTAQSDFESEWQELQLKRSSMELLWQP